MAALAVAAIGVVAIAGTALAGHQTSGVKSYTGCLVSGDGVLIKIKEGNAPRSACTGGQVEAHFSGGDITAITAQTGGGLVGGGENGAVSLSLRRDCSSGEVVKWNGSGWACAADANSTYTAGTGLDLSAGEFSLEESYRLPQNCASGEAAIRNTAVGGGAATWACEQFANADQTCTSGQFARGVTALGALDCAAPASDGGVSGFTESRDEVILGGETTVITQFLPAGSYILFAIVDLLNKDFTSTSTAFCKMPGYVSDSYTLATAGRASISMMSALGVHPGGNVVVQCTETDANVDVTQARFNAIKLDGLG